MGADATAASASVSLAFGFASKLYAGELNLIASRLYAHVLNVMNLMLRAPSALCPAHPAATMAADATKVIRRRIESSYRPGWAFWAESYQCI